MQSVIALQHNSRTRAPREACGFVFCVCVVLVVVVVLGCIYNLRYDK